MTKPHKVVHQFGLFGYQRPKITMPKKEKQALAKLLRESKALFESGNHEHCVVKLRKFREGLDDIASRISNASE